MQRFVLYKHEGWRLGSYQAPMPLGSLTTRLAQLIATPTSSETSAGVKKKQAFNGPSKIGQQLNCEYSTCYVMSEASGRVITPQKGRNPSGRGGSRRIYRCHVYRMNLNDLEYVQSI